MYKLKVKGTGADWIGQQGARDTVRSGYRGPVVLRVCEESAVEDLLNAEASIHDDLRTLLETSRVAH